MINIEKCAIELVQAIDEFIEFVRQKGPKEYCDKLGKEYEYYSDRALPLERVDMDEIVRLDAIIGNQSQAIGISMPPKKEGIVANDCVQYGYTAVVIEWFYGFTQPYLPTTLKPDPDWEYRLKALRQLALDRAGLSGPRWREANNQILFDGIEIKKYTKHPAPNHRVILNAFESAKWINPIANPFLNRGQLSSPKEILDDTIRSMKSIPLIGFAAIAGGKVEWKRKQNV